MVTIYPLDYAMSQIKKFKNIPRVKVTFTGIKKFKNVPG